MTFEKWWEENSYTIDHPMTKLDAKIVWNGAWQAATLAERERCAKVADSIKFPVKHDATDELHNYTCNKIAAAIRKGEGV